jgi:methyl-accepting chemotaxis protein
MLGANFNNMKKKEGSVRTFTLEELTSPRSYEAQFGEVVMRLTLSPIFTAQKERLGTIIEMEDRTTQVGIEREVAEIVNGASRGDLSGRIRLEGKEGFLLHLSTDINSLVQTSQVVLSDILRVLAALSQGDLTESIGRDYDGTFGQLKNDANQTVVQLNRLVGEIRMATDAINTAASEIAQGNNDLSTRTQQQASNLEQTTASMEKLTTTVRQNAQSAENANAMARGASDVAKRGGTVVSGVVNTMESITESSKKIADIIGVIDGIAFQTNILALNAAVEAARAGEQGRGFAVVATEVRNLAQRSSNAAKEIKELISSSQEKVSSGSKQVAEAGQTMQDIVSSVNHVSTIIAEITAASREQSGGIEQVNQAIMQFDQLTQQNAALVEQAAAAAESMEEQAHNLNASVGAFKVSSAATNARVRSSSGRSATNRAAFAGTSLRATGTTDEWSKF